MIRKNLVIGSESIRGSVEERPKDSVSIFRLKLMRFEF